MNKLHAVIQIPELPSTDENFRIGKLRAQVEGKTVHITRRTATGKIVPVMEFEAWSGKYNEIGAPMLKVSIMERMLQRIEDLPTTKQATRIISEYMGLEVKLAELP